MLKRFACLMAALLMLVGAAQAEAAYQLVASCTLNAEETALYLNAVTGGDVSLQPRIKALAEGMAKLLNNASIKLIAQDNGASLTLLVQDEVLLDLIYESTESGEWMALPSLLPGNAMVSKPDAQAQAASERLFGEFPLMDWAGMADSLMLEVVAWAAELPQSTEMGRFMGDAYEGGAFCTTVTFDDRNLSALLERLLSAMEGKLGKETLAELDESLRVLHGVAQAMSGGEGRYILRCVSDMQGSERAFCGCSLTVLHQNEQQMTFSLGVTDENIRLVWGFGTTQGNRYMEAALSPLSATETKLVFSVYDDPLRLGFRAVRMAEEQCLLLRADSTMAVQTDDNGASWSAVTLVAQPKTTDVLLRCEGEGSYSEEVFSQTWNAFVNDSPDACLSASIQVAPSEPLTFDWSGLESIEMEDTEASAVLEDVGKALSLRLFRLIPPELLTFLLQ